MRLYESYSEDETELILDEKTETVTFTVEGSGEVVIDWGDGAIDFFTIDADPTEAVHRYPDLFAEQRIRITGEVSALDCSRNGLTALDVSSNAALTNLDCSFNELTALYTGGNAELRLLRCAGNCLTSLDVSCNINLEELYCHNNQFKT
jgi:Leucine-rich repeat (LRR) protein